MCQLILGRFKLLDIKGSLVGLLNPILTLLGINTSDKDSSLDRIKSKIEKIDKKFVLLIDDLDRLEKDEILNIFKLIRSVADFKNFIFIIAYDNENVKKITEKDDIFLNKFFDLRIDLFERSEYKMDEFIKNELNDFFQENIDLININLDFLIENPLIYDEKKINNI